MIHHRQCLTLGFKPGDHLPRVHARLDDLQRDAPLDRLLLLGHVDDAHAAFAELLEQLVGADLGAGLFGDGLVEGGLRLHHGSRHETAGLVDGFQ